MAKNTRWSVDDFKKLKLVQDANGNYVPVSSLTPKGRVDKLPNLLERAIPFKDKERFMDDLITLGMGAMKTEIINGKPTVKYIDPIDDELRVAIYNAEHIDSFLTIKKIPANETFQLPDDAYIDVLYSFDITPVSAPRMTQSDKWKTDPNHIDPDKRQRKPVEKYFKFKRGLLSLCAENGYKLTPRLNILFVVPMSKSWSKKKREFMNNAPHQFRPDRDNYLKAFQDSFNGDDGHVWDGRTIKLWGEKGRIIIF